MEELFQLSEDSKYLIKVLDKNIKEFAIPNSVVKIGQYAFCGCKSLESIDIPNSVTEVGDWAFEGCTSLESIDIPNSVTEIGEKVLSLCKSLKYINIPNSVKEIREGTFWRCSSLESINLPDGLLRIGHSAFADCENLENTSYTCLVGINTFPSRDVSTDGYYINVLQENKIKIPETWTNVLQNCDVTISIMAYAIQADLPPDYLTPILEAQGSNNMNAKAQAIAKATLQICKVDFDPLAE
jgi:hypothetical protein